MSIQRSGGYVAAFFYLAWGIAITSSASFGQSRSVAPSTSGDPVVDLNCANPTLWENGSPRQANYDFHRCGLDWIHRNANEVRALRTVQLDQIKTQIVKADQDENSGDSGRQSQARSVRDGLVRDHYCVAGDSVRTCKERIDRLVLSHTVELREGTLQSNTVLSSLKSDRQGTIQAGSPGAGNQPQGQPLKQVDLAIAERQRQIQAMQQAAAPPPCRTGILVPCVVHFGNNQSRDLVEQRDQASQNLTQGQFRISAAQTVAVPGTTGETREVLGAGPDRSETRLRQALSSQTTYQRTLYQQDIGAQERLREELKRKDQASQGSTSLANGPAWEALGEALRSMQAQRRRQSASGSGGPSENWLHVGISDAPAPGSRSPSSGSPSGGQRPSGTSTGQSQGADTLTYQTLIREAIGSGSLPGGGSPQ